jgi:hypothetical protein
MPRHSTVLSARPWTAVGLYASLLWALAAAAEVPTEPAAAPGAEDEAWAMVVAEIAPIEGLSLVSQKLTPTVEIRDGRKVAVAVLYGRYDRPQWRLAIDSGEVPVDAEGLFQWKIVLRDDMEQDVVATGPDRQTQNCKIEVSFPNWENFKLANHLEGSSGARVAETAPLPAAEPQGAVPAVPSAPERGLAQEPSPAEAHAVPTSNSVADPAAGADESSKRPDAFSPFSLRTSREVNNLQLSVMSEYFCASHGGSSLCTWAWGAGMDYGLSRRWAFGLSLRQGLDPTQSFDALFTAVEMRLTYALTGSLLAERSTVSLGGADVLTASDGTTSGWRIRLAAAEYLFNLASGDTAYSSISGSFGYQLRIGSSTAAELGVRTDRLYRSGDLIYSTSAWLGVSFWL